MWLKHVNMSGEEEKVGRRNCHRGQITPALVGQGAPEKSGLHACGQADRVIALESWEGLGPPDAQQQAFARASLVVQMVKNLPAMHETWVQSLGWEDYWRREWQPTPVFLPGESQEQGSLVGCCLWGCTESDMTEAT